MQPLGLHGSRVHVAFIGGVVEDPEFRLWGQLQTDVTHQDADNRKGTCGVPPASKSEVWATPLDDRKGPRRASLLPEGWVPMPPTFCSYVTMTYAFKGLSPQLLKLFCGSREEMSLETQAVPDPDTGLVTGPLLSTSLRTRELQVSLQGPA